MKLCDRGFIFLFSSVIVFTMMNLSTAQAVIINQARVDFGGLPLTGCGVFGSGDVSVGPCSAAGRSLVGRASAKASFGASGISLGAAGTVRGFTYGFDDGLEAWGTARINDTVVIRPTNSSLVGQAGTGFFTFELTGQLDADGVILDTRNQFARAVAGLGFLVSVDQTNILAFIEQLTPSNSLNFSTVIPTATYDFIYGYPMDINMYLAAGATLFFRGNTGVTGTFDLFADFFNTVVLETIVVTDQFGTNVQAALATSNGEVLLETEGNGSQTIPEPATVLLMGFGLAGLWFSRRRGRDSNPGTG